MYKTLLDHRFADEFQQLLTVRAALANDMADEAQRHCPSRAAKTGMRLIGTELSGDTHPLTAEWFKFTQPRFAPVHVHLIDLPEELANRIKCYVIIASEHVVNRTLAKRLINELEATLHHREVAAAWPESSFAFKDRQIETITAELNQLLRL